MFLTSREMYAAEDALFESGVAAESLMNMAGQKIAQEILGKFAETPPGRAVAVVGTGNNGADALVALRHFKEAGWEVSVRSAIQPSEMKGLLAKKWHELGSAQPLDSLEEFYKPGPFVILDGLLGIGTKGDLREPLSKLAGEINGLSQKRMVFVAAVDVPSGLNCDTGQCGRQTVRANLTCTLGSPKIGLIADQATDYVGSLALLTLNGLSNWKAGEDHLITPATLPVEKLSRPYEFHKGQAGRIGMIAGSQGLAGAAALTSLGALRGGGGLITLFVRKEDYPLILPLIPVEIMVKPVDRYVEALHENLDALAVGPGLGKAGQDILSVIKNFKGPTVIDADALNLIARQSHISTLRANHLVTPHAGEIARLLRGGNEPNNRAAIARKFTSQSEATLLFKGARTIVTNRSSPIAYNTTGTPGMATGGQGDVLSGLLAALMARGFEPLEAAKTGSWLCGCASELALPRQSEESLSAITTIDYIGSAFKKLRSAPI